MKMLRLEGLNMEPLYRCLLNHVLKAELHIFLVMAIEVNSKGHDQINDGLKVMP